MHPRVLLVPVFALPAAIALGTAIAQLPLPEEAHPPEAGDNDAFGFTRSTVEIYHLSGYEASFTPFVGEFPDFEIFTASLSLDETATAQGIPALNTRGHTLAATALDNDDEARWVRLYERFDQPPIPVTSLVVYPRKFFRIEARIPQSAHIPLYHFWVELLRNSPPPRRARAYLPTLKKIFADEGVPEAFVWLAEAESMFDPGARSAAGALGLFQLMPATAREHGLRVRPHDERINPRKNARAAAIHLRELHEEFASWPLALAAYNAGKSCVRRSLQTGDARTFAEIADELPMETRLYVPRVLATLAVREGIDPVRLAALSHR